MGNPLVVREVELQGAARQEDAEHDQRSWKIAIPVCVARATRSALKRTKSLQCATLSAKPENTRTSQRNSGHLGLVTSCCQMGQNCFTVSGHGFDRLAKEW